MAGKQVNWASDAELAIAHKRDCETMECGHLHKHLYTCLPGEMICQVCENNRFDAECERLRQACEAADQRCRDLANALDVLLCALQDEYGTGCICEIDGQGEHAPLCPLESAHAVLHPPAPPPETSA